MKLEGRHYKKYYVYAYVYIYTYLYIFIPFSHLLQLTFNEQVDNPSMKFFCDKTLSFGISFFLYFSKADNWPAKLLMQLIPKTLVSNLGGTYFKNARSVLFHPNPGEALDNLARVMSTGYAGCVHFNSG